MARHVLLQLTRTVYLVFLARYFSRSRNQIRTSSRNAPKNKNKPITRTPKRKWPTRGNDKTESPRADARASCALAKRKMSSLLIVNDDRSWWSRKHRLSLFVVKQSDCHEGSDGFVVREVFRWIASFCVWKFLCGFGFVFWAWLCVSFCFKSWFN